MGYSVGKIGVGGEGEECLVVHADEVVCGLIVDVVVEVGVSKRVYAVFQGYEGECMEDYVEVGCEEEVSTGCKGV